MLGLPDDVPPRARQSSSCGIHPDDRDALTGAVDTALRDGTGSAWNQFSGRTDGNSSCANEAHRSPATAVPGSWDDRGRHRATGPRGRTGARTRTARRRWPVRTLRRGWTGRRGPWGWNPIPYGAAMNGPIRVIIADDDDTMRETLRDLLAAADGVEGRRGRRRRHDRDRPVRPRPAGCQSCSTWACRAAAWAAQGAIHQQHPEVAILALTADDDDRTRSAMLKAGASAVLIKGLRRRALLEAIHAVGRRASSRPAGSTPPSSLTHRRRPRRTRCGGQVLEYVRPPTSAPR